MGKCYNLLLRTSIIKKYKKGEKNKVTEKEKSVLSDPVAQLVLGGTFLSCCRQHA